MFLVYSGNIWKQDILYCWGNANNEEEYRRDAAIKQKTEGIPYRTIARNLDKRVDAMRSKRNNAGEYQRYLLTRTIINESRYMKISGFGGHFFKYFIWCT